MWEAPPDWKTLHPSLNLNLDDDTPYVMHNGAVHIGTQVRPLDYFDVLAMSANAIANTQCKRSLTFRLQQPDVEENSQFDNFCVIRILLLISALNFEKR